MSQGQILRWTRLKSSCTAKYGCPRPLHAVRSRFIFASCVTYFDRAVIWTREQLVARYCQRTHLIAVTIQRRCASVRLRGPDLQRKISFSRNYIMHNSTISKYKYIWNILWRSYQSCLRTRDHFSDPLRVRRPNCCARAKCRRTQACWRPTRAQWHRSNQNTIDRWTASRLRHRRSVFWPTWRTSTAQCPTLAQLRCHIRWTICRRVWPIHERHYRSSMFGDK